MKIEIITYAATIILIITLAIQSKIIINNKPRFKKNIFAILAIFMFSYSINAIIHLPYLLEISREISYDHDTSVAKQADLFRIKNIAEKSRTKLKKAAWDSGRPVRIYLHWTAGHYGQFFNAYHINIDYDGKFYVFGEDFSQFKAHTWRRNRGAIGIALACAYKATPDNLGSEPPTAAQIDAAAQAVAVLAKVLNIPITQNYIMTHAEAAALDGYGLGSGQSQTRWDLWYLKNGDPKGSGGQKIRDRAVYYQKNDKLSGLFQ